MSNFSKVTQHSWAGRQSFWLQIHHSKLLLDIPLGTWRRGRQSEHTCIPGSVLEEKEFCRVSEVISHAVAPGTGWERKQQNFTIKGITGADIWAPTCQPGAWSLFRKEPWGGTGWHFRKDYFKMQGRYCFSPIKWQRPLKCSFPGPALFQHTGLSRG